MIVSRWMMFSDRMRTSEAGQLRNNLAAARWNMAVMAELSRLNPQTHPNQCLAGTVMYTVRHPL